MFLAQRTKQRFKIVLLCSLAYSFVVLALAIFAPLPGVPFSVAYGRWLLGIPATLAVWFTSEFLVTWALERPFWNHMPGWGRVALLVVLISVFAVVAAWLIQLWQAQNAA